jgi:hypothetical protein
MKDSSNRLRDIIVIVITQCHCFFQDAETGSAPTDPPKSQTTTTNANTGSTPSGALNLNQFSELLYDPNFLMAFQVIFS